MEWLELLMETKPTYLLIGVVVVVMILVVYTTTVALIMFKYEKRKCLDQK